MPWHTLRAGTTLGKAAHALFSPNLVVECDDDAVMMLALRRVNEYIIRNIYEYDINTYNT